MDAELVCQVHLQCHGMPCHLRHSLNAVRAPKIHGLHSLSHQQQAKVDFVLFYHPMYASDHTCCLASAECPFDIDLLHILLHSISQVVPMTC